MKIILLGQYFEPEGAAGANRMRRFVEALKKRHRVQVITGMPCYPTGKLTKKYRGKMYVRERRQRVDVLRTYEYATANEGGFLRILNYISFMISAIIGSFWVGPADIVIATSPPLSVALTGYIIAKIKRAKFVFDVRDLWPESILELGFIKKRLLYRMLKNIALFLYKNSNLIFCIGPGMRRRLTRIVPSQKVVTLLNTTDIETFRYRKVSRRRYGLQERDFVVSYVGGFSEAYDFNFIIQVARKLPGIQFLLVGAGEAKDRVVESIHNNNLKNIIVNKEVAHSDVSRYLSLSDIGLIPYKKTKLTNSSIPSKIFEYLACRTPVIVAAGGDVANIINKNKCGYVVEPGNFQKAIEVIRRESQNRAKLRDMGQNGREAVVREYSNKGFIKVVKTAIDGL